MILVLDNHDSFTFNLVQGLGSLGAEVVVWASDQVSVADVLGSGAQGIVISPGPGHPDDAGISVQLVRALSGQVPLLGVCLGHQAICRAFDARVERAARPLHGKTSAITHDGAGVFTALPSPLQVARYHSLSAVAGSLPPVLKASAFADDGTLMAVRHTSLPIEGIQFHPESFLTEHGQLLLANFCASVSRAPAVRC